MSERLASIISRMRVRPSTIREDEIPLFGGVNTEDPYGGRMGQGALRDCHNVDIAEYGYGTKGGWVRFGQSSYTTPPEGARVIYCKYEYFDGIGSPSNIPPAPLTTISNFNGSGEDVIVLSSRWRSGYESDPYYISFYLEVFFIVFDDSDLSIYEGSTVGTSAGPDPGWTFSGGPYAIDELGQDPIDIAAQADGADVVRLNEDIDSYRIAAYNYFRALVTRAFNPSTESGVGIFSYKNALYVMVDAGSTYAIRKCDATNAWVNVLKVDAGVDAHKIMYFQGGLLEIEEGAAIVGATSGATATAYRVVILDGSFEGGDARGYISVSSTYSGGFTAGENITVGGIVHAAIPASGNISEFVYLLLTASGTPKFRSIKYNFNGFVNRESVYFATGTSYAFEFYYDADANIYIITPIKTLIGIDDISNYNSVDAEDKPDQITVNRGTLFLGYDGGSIQNSASGNPLDFRVVVGYDEKSIGEEITNFVPEISGSLLVSAKNSWWALYGDNQQNYDLQLVATDVGALADSVSSAAGVVFMDSQGITTIKQAAEFGNWAVNSLSKDVDKKMRWLMRYCTPVKTILVRDKSIIRFFFDQTVAAASETDPQTIWLALKVGKSGFDGYTFGTYNKRIIDVTESEMQVTAPGRPAGVGPESREVFFLATDGYVYRDEQACVADDEPLTYSIDTAVLVGKSKGVNKHWHEVFFDASSRGQSEVQVEMTFHDSNGFRRIAQARAISLPAESSYWDSGLWDVARWDDTGGSVVRMKMMGSGTGVSFNITGSKFNREPDTFRSIKTNFVPTSVRRSR